MFTLQTAAAEITNTLKKETLQLEEEGFSANQRHFSIVRTLENSTCANCGEEYYWLECFTYGNTYTSVLSCSCEINTFTVETKLSPIEVEAFKHIGWWNGETKPTN